jgi:hypothetical protein
LADHDAVLGAVAKPAEDARVAAEAKAAAEARTAAVLRAAEEARAAEAAAEAGSVDGGGDQPAAIRPGAPSQEPSPRRPTGASDQPDPNQPGVRKPTLDIPTRPKPKPEDPIPTIVAQPGDIICRFCSMPNEPTRTFCRRCGKRLGAEPLPPPKLPWYRRLFQRAPRSAKAMQAGQRPKGLGDKGQQQPSVIRRFAPFLIVAVLAFGITSVVLVPGVRTFFGDLVTDLRLRFLPEIDDVHPVKVTGAEGGTNPGKLAADFNTATFWLADPGGSATITAEFASTFNLGALVVSSGPPTEADLLKHARPKTLEITFPGTDKPAVKVALEDVFKPQPVELDVRGVKTVAVRVVDSFPAGPGGDTRVAVREIEFKQRK